VNAFATVSSASNLVVSLFGQQSALLNGFLQVALVYLRTQVFHYCRERSLLTVVFEAAHFLHC